MKIGPPIYQKWNWPTLLHCSIDYRQAWFRSDILSSSETLCNHLQSGHLSTGTARGCWYSKKFGYLVILSLMEWAIFGESSFSFASLLIASNLNVRKHFILHWAASIQNWKTFVTTKCVKLPRFTGTETYNMVKYSYYGGEKKHN